MKVLICIGLALLNLSFMSQKDLPIEDKMAYQAMREFSTTQFKNDLHQIGEGLRGDKKRIECFSIVFETKKQLSIEIGRKLAVEAVNDFVAFINKQEDLKPYLPVYPITNKQVSVGIIYRGDNCKSDCIRSVNVENGWICYHENDIKPPNFGLIKEETFEEAVAIVKQHSQRL